MSKRNNSTNKPEYFKALRDIPHGDSNRNIASMNRDIAAELFGKFVEKNQKKIKELMMIVNKYWYKRYAIRLEDYHNAVGEAYQLGMKHAKEK